MPSPRHHKGNSAPTKSRRSSAVGPERRRQGQKCARRYELELELLREEHQQTVAAQFELELSRDRYADLLELAPIGFATLGRAGEILEINGSGAVLLGYKRADLIGRPFLMSLIKSDRLKFLDHLSKARRLGPAKSNETKVDLAVERKKGQRLVIEFSSAIRLSELDDAIYFHTVFRDVTQERQVEMSLLEARQDLERRVEERTAQLQETLNRLNDLYHKAPCGYHSLDSHAVFVEINETGLQLLGYGRDDLLGKKTAFDLQSPQSRRLGMETFKQLLEQGAIHDVELEFVRKDGSILPVLLSASSIRDASGRFVRSRSTFIDLTERKQIEKALRDSEARLQAILDNSPQMIFLKDLEGRYLHYNRQFASEFALSEALGKTDFEIFPEPQAQLFRKHDLKVIETGQAIQFEEVATQSDGLHTSIVSKFPIPDAQGRIYAVGGIVTDITERRRLEAEVVRISDHEKQRIAQDLHDGLGQQLAGTWFLSDMLRRNLEAAQSPELPAATQIVELLKTTVGQARSLSRGLSPIPDQPDGLMVALEGLAAQISEMFLVNCRFVCPQPVPVDDANIATHLYRIAQEATHNAFRHGQAAVIEIELSARRKQLLLRISDDGIGIQDPPKRHKGMGLHTMNYRADLIGADFAIHKVGSRGTEVVCRMRI